MYAFCAIGICVQTKKWAKPLGILITGIAIVSIGLSVSSSIAMASTQISSGMKIITGINFSTIGWQTVVLIIIASPLYFGRCVAD